MKCPNCNHTIPDHTDFCAYCGKKVQVPPSPGGAVSSADSRLRLGVLAVVGVIVLIVGFMALRGLGGSDDPGTTDSGGPTSGEAAGQTAPATSTPVPTSIPPSATKTATPVPTSTLPPSPTAEPNCDVSSDPQLSPAWDRRRLGCPTTSANVVWAAWQHFEGGYMLWRSDTRRVIAFYNDGSWDEFPDQWTEGAPIPSRGSPPAGRLAPIRGFGYLWGTHDEVAQRLGWALEEEKGFCANIQSFEQGFIFHSSTVRSCLDDLYNWATHPSFTPLFISISTEGTWWRHQ